MQSRFSNDVNSTIQEIFLFLDQSQLVEKAAVRAKINKKIDIAAPPSPTVNNGAEK